MDIARGKDALASTLERYGLGLHPRQWRVPPIDTYPRAIAFAKTVPGRLVLIAVFAVLIRLQGWDLWLWTTAAAAITSFAGRHRHVVALLCTGAILARAPDWFNYRAVYLVAEQESLLSSLHLGQVRAATLLACALLAAGSIWLARHYRHHPYGQRPVLIQHAVFLLFLLGVSLAPLHGMSRIVAWSLFTVFLAYFWFMAYALIDQRTKNPSGLIFQLATFHPFYGSTTSPWGKGAAYLRSVENPDVFFAGDAIPGRPQLSPLATYEGRVVGHNLTHDALEPARYGHQPAAVYTVPALATVGWSEAAAREAGFDFDVRTHDMTGWRSARTHGETAAWAKVLVEKGSGRILGAHLVGHGAEETIHAFAIAVEKGMPASELAERVYAYPTFHADIKYMVS